MIIQSFCIPGCALIDIKEVNRLVREAFVWVCGNGVFECVRTRIAMRVCGFSFVLWSSMCTVCPLAFCI